MSSIKIICPNGHLGFAPMKLESFKIAVEENPTYIAADSGSDDIGPGPLGNDSCASPAAWQIHDLEHMLLAARDKHVPMIIGSAGDTGTNSRVDLYVSYIKDIAKKHNLAPFKIGYFYSEVPTDYLASKLDAGTTIAGLDGFPDLTQEELDATDRVVAMAGVHPFLELLKNGADVIIGGRSSDSAIFAAAALHEGFDESNAYYLGKVLECASFCAEPYGAKETVMGEIIDNGVEVTAMHPDQRCTIASVAGHAMYERSNPYFEYVSGGRLNMTDCHYTQKSEKTTRVTGSLFEPSETLTVKLEGSGKVGERYVGMASIRDPYTIAHVDQVVAWARAQVQERFGDSGYEVNYNIYGKNGVMGMRETVKESQSHELCIVVQAVAKDKAQAEEICTTATRQLFYARLPEVKGTAGGVSFEFDEVLPASPGFRWTLNHVLEIEDPLDFFPVQYTQSDQ
ncbi:MAG: acyclic terpene utilization AtuA family protein [Alphaproteobacteria bacterium]|nr:acyclic terpene utilization AtuA family protein [Alphaproteobacteria bacterium]